MNILGCRLHVKALLLAGDGKGCRRTPVRHHAPCPPYDTVCLRRMPLGSTV